MNNLNKEKNIIFTKEMKESAKLDLKEMISDYESRNSKPLSSLLNFNVFNFYKKDTLVFNTYEDKTMVNNIWLHKEMNEIQIKDDLLEKAFKALDFLWFKNIENFCTKKLIKIEQTKTKISDLENLDKSWKESSINLIKEITSFILEFYNVKNEKYKGEEYDLKLIFSNELNSILNLIPDEDIVSRFHYLIKTNKIKFITSNFLNKEKENTPFDHSGLRKKTTNLNLKNFHVLMFLFNKKENRWPVNTVINETTMIWNILEHQMIWNDSCETRLKLHYSINKTEPNYDLIRVIKS